MRLSSSQPRLSHSRALGTGCEWDFSCEPGFMSQAPISVPPSPCHSANSTGTTGKGRGNCRSFDERPPRSTSFRSRRRQLASFDLLHGLRSFRDRTEARWDSEVMALVATHHERRASFVRIVRGVQIGAARSGGAGRAGQKREQEIRRVARSLGNRKCQRPRSVACKPR